MRIFSNCNFLLIALLLATVLSHFANAQTVPEVDPYREWLANEYADTIFTEFKKQYPDIQLAIDTKDLPDMESGNWNLKTAIASFRQALRDSAGAPLQLKLVNAVKAALPNEVNTLITNTLQPGGEVLLQEKDLALPSELKAWVLQRPDASVAPHEFMIEALRLSNGHVITAWSTAWNVLRENWIASPTRNYGALHAKFISLTGERNLWQGGQNYVMQPASDWKVSEGEIFRTKKNGFGEIRLKVKDLKKFNLVTSKRGDEFSYLYHRTGVELLAILTAKKTNSAIFGEMLGKASALGEYFSFSNTAGIHGEHIKRVHNDLLAARSGARIYQLVEKQKFPALPRATNGAANYLVSNYWKFGGKYQLKDGRPTHYYRSKVDSKYWAPTMSLEELKERLRYALLLDENILSPVLLSSTGEAERMHRALVDYIDRGAPDAEFNKMIKLWLNGNRGRTDNFDENFDANISEVDNINYALGADPTFDFEKQRTSLEGLFTRISTMANKQKLAAKKQTVPSQEPSTTIAPSCKSDF
jgi:hypothetical protein